MERKIYSGEAKNYVQAISSLGFLQVYSGRQHDVETKICLDSGVNIRFDATPSELRCGMDLDITLCFELDGEHVSKVEEKVLTGLGIR